jgi:hypothetical protein
LKILGPFELSKGGYRVEKSYKLNPAKKLKNAKEKEAWRIYIREQMNQNYSWKKFNKNFQRFYGEDYER